jgi:hypothetical protein
MGRAAINNQVSVQMINAAFPLIRRHEGKLSAEVVD